MRFVEYPRNSRAAMVHAFNNTLTTAYVRLPDSPSDRNRDNHTWVSRAQNMGSAIFHVLDFKAKREARERERRHLRERKQATLETRELARRYLKSIPGTTDMATEVTFNIQSRIILKVDDLTLDQILATKRHLSYRMDLMRRATEYKDLLELDFEGCEGFNFERWESRIMPLDGKKSETWTRYRESQKILIDLNLFATPGPREIAYAKPRQYLGAAYVEDGLDKREMFRVTVRIMAIEQRLRKYRSLPSGLEAVLPEDEDFRSPFCIEDGLVGIKVKMEMAARAHTMRVDGDR